MHGLARAQASQGHEVHVLTNSAGGAEDDVVLDGVHVHRIAFPNPPCPADGHGEVLQWNHGVVSRALDRLDRLRGVDLVLGHDWLTAIAAREVAAALGRPLVVTFHDEVTGKHQGLLGPEARFVRDLEALTAHDASHVIANSGYTARQLERHYGVAPGRVSAIPGGIDPTLLDLPAPDELWAFRRALLPPREPPALSEAPEAPEVPEADPALLVLYVGRLDPEKGLGTLARAWARVRAACPAAQLLLAGSGRLEPALRAQLQPAGAEGPGASSGGVRFLGYVEREALAYLYRAADVVVVPSLYEPFGLVALEAMLAGRAVVASCVGGLAEILEPEPDSAGLPGLLVPPADPEALAAALLRVLGDPGLRARLGLAARARALERFSWDAIARQTDLAYAHALDRPGRHCTRPPALPPPPLVSVVLVGLGAPTRAPAALRGLVTRTRYRPLEVLVVAPAPALDQDALAREVARAEARGVLVRLFASEPEARAAARGTRLGRLDVAVEVPPGSEAWLDGLVWLLDEVDAFSAPAGTPPVTVGPTLLSRSEAAARGLGSGRAHLPRLAEPERLTGADPACFLTRWAPRRPGAASEAGPVGGAWRHGVPLVVDRGRGDLPVSIVIVAYRQLALTRAAIDAVLEHTAPPFELVLVDNGSCDGPPGEDRPGHVASAEGSPGDALAGDSPASGTLGAFEGYAARLGGAVAVQVVALDANYGYPVGANRGVAVARGRHVVLLNNDARVRPGWLAALLRALDHPGPAPVGVVTAKVLDLDGTVQSAGGIEHRPDGRFVIPGQGEDRLAPTVTARREVPNAGGPCLLLSRALLDRLAPDGRVFDEAYSPGYFEDSDLCLRARAAGFRLVYEPGAEVFHHGKATSSLVAREGRLDVWGRFEENRRRFHARWADTLAADAALAGAQAGDAQARQARLRILLCYDRSATTTAAYCEAALRRAHDVVTAGRGQDLDPGQRPGLADDAPAVVEAAAARLGGPVDLLLAIEGETYVPRGVERAPCRTALWLIDTHLHARRDDDLHAVLAPRFDRVFVAQRAGVDALARWGVDARWLPLACDPEVHRQPTPAGGRDLDLVFVGHVRPFHARRRRLLERLRARFEARHRVEVREGVWREDMARLFARAKVVWNCSLAGDLNMRVFEALASGAVLVTDRLPDGSQDALFAPGEHLLVYDDDTLEDVVERALADAPMREAIAARGQALALRHHTYAGRMTRLVGEALAGEASRQSAAGVPLHAGEARS